MTVSVTTGRFALNAVAAMLQDHSRIAALSVDLLKHAAHRVNVRNERGDLLTARAASRVKRTYGLGKLSISKPHMRGRAAVFDLFFKQWGDLDAVVTRLCYPYRMSTYARVIPHESSSSAA